MVKRKTLSELKRLAKTGKLYATMVIRCGGPATEIDFPERLKGERQIINSNSVGITFKNADGTPSELYIKNAALTEFTGNELTIYSPGYRETTPQEQAVLDDWQKIADSEEYQRQMDIDCLSDGSQCYWREKCFFKERDMEYLLGFEEKRGAKLDWNVKNRGKKAFIRDTSIRGEINMKYVIREREGVCNGNITNSFSFKAGGSSSAFWKDTEI